MGVSIKKINTVVDSNGYLVRPGRLCITEEKILEYIKDHPVPEDPEYNLDGLITGLTDPPTWFIFLPDVKEETMRYIEKLIDELRNDRKTDIWKL